MAKRIIWSKQALNERKEILQYWKKHHQSATYSIKLNDLFKKAIRLIAMHPRVGRMTDMQNIRIKLVRDYLLVYEETDEALYILNIWHSSRNPDEFGVKKI